ncbi:chromate resistance protein ChrB domain-containing protein [Olivibacter jilunii]|uniref:chromate resistance protein ChrB domain-containing protein n=1 Tax=Olivibacter jilunii TaxID=985016 RepID=UPI003F13B21B
MKWITRERPKIDRIACPWLIKRFIDPGAEIVFVPAEDVIRVAEQIGATPFDIPGVEYSHYEDKCTFDYFIKKYELKNPAMPEWVITLRELIQDQVDTNMNLTLHQLSDELELSPTYLSREFSKYFDNVNFGEYIRKKRIEKAIELMADPSLNLTEIAYLTGFSDQSHFTRIFNKHMGSNPSVYRKKIIKGKGYTKG